MMQYHKLVMMFGAPNGLCSLIMESKHIKAVIKPWCRSSKFNALGQILWTNSHMDNLSSLTVDFQACRMLKESIWVDYMDPPPPPLAPNPLPDKDDDGGGIDDREMLGEVKLAKEPGMSFICTFFAILKKAQFIISNVLLQTFQMP